MRQTPLNLVLATALLAASAYCLADNKIVINANVWTGNSEFLPCY